MRFASLGSGSKGNALVVESGATRILLDCGFGPREAERRLARIGLVPADIDAILVTHEHGDHVGGVARFVARHGMRAYLTHGTLRAVGDTAFPADGFRVLDSHTVFAIGDIEIRPFPVPHDAGEPVQFVFSNGHRRLGVITDTGCVTPHIIAMLKGCEGLVIECNHDGEMLMNGRYPPALKRRIAGDYGHLENSVAAALLRQVATEALQHVVAAHLSEQNNLPALAKQILADVLGCDSDWVGVATQEEGFGWRSLA